jgi:uncharacterized repeat protein (TIGR01451 family)
MNVIAYQIWARRGAETAAVLLALASGSTAHAACSAANQYAFNFSSQAATTLAYGSTYTYTATSTALGSQNFSVQLLQNGLTSTTVGGEVRPNISASHNGGGTVTALVVGGVLGSRTADITSATRTMRAIFTFPTPIRDMAITVHDIDLTANQFRDWLHVSGSNGASTYIPTLTTPWTMANSTGPFTNASSSLTLGPNTTGGVTATVSQAVGLGASGNNSTTGNVNISFAQPVTSVAINYGNYPLTGTETTTGQQAYAISSVSWCPMPLLTTVKSSTPVVTALTDPARFNTPGSDVYYSITVANSNSSPVDANAIFVGDIMPAAITFLNGDIDDAGPLTTNYEFLPGTSGLTLAAGNIAYSNNAGATYAYTPAAGYDPAMTAVRFNPQGPMAANSSFTVRFRGKIK